MIKKNKKKEPVDEVEILKKRLKAKYEKENEEEKKRLDKTIRLMKEGKLETLGTIVVGEDEIHIHTAGDKLIWMNNEFLNKFVNTMSFMGNPPEFDLIISRIREIQAKRMRHDAEERIREEEAKKKT